MFELVSQESESFGDSLGFFETEDLCIIGAIDRGLEVFCIEYWYMSNYQMISYGIERLRVDTIKKDLLN